VGCDRTVCARGITLDRKKKEEMEVREFVMCAGGGKQCGHQEGTKKGDQRGINENGQEVGKGYDPLETGVGHCGKGVRFLMVTKYEKEVAASRGERKSDRYIEGSWGKLGDKIKGTGEGLEKKGHMREGKWSRQSRQEPN